MFSEAQRLRARGAAAGARDASSTGTIRDHTGNFFERSDYGTEEKRQAISPPRLARTARAWHGALTEV